MWITRLAGGRAVYLAPTAREDHGDPWLYPRPDLGLLQSHMIHGQDLPTRSGDAVKSICLIFKQLRESRKGKP